MKIRWMVVSLWILSVSGHWVKAQQESPTGEGEVAARGMDKEEYAELAKAQRGKLKKEYETRKRSRGPFGAVMDPATIKEEPVIAIADIVETQEVVPVKKAASLQEAVDKFQVNGVNAAKQMVMVGFRSLRRGDPVEISHDGELFKLRIEKITRDEVVFLNTKNNQTASVRLGVVKGIRGIKSNGLKGNVLKKNSTLKIK